MRILERNSIQVSALVNLQVRDSTGETNNPKEILFRDSNSRELRMMTYTVDYLI